MMPKISIGLGALFVILGLASFFGTGAEHITALIPTFFGVIFILLGIISQAGEKARKHSMHVAALLALIGVLGSFRGIIDLFAAAGGAELDTPLAAVGQAIMAVGLIVFLVLAVKSFREARMQANQD